MNVLHCLIKYAEKKVSIHCSFLYQRFKLQSSILQTTTLSRALFISLHNTIRKVVRKLTDLKNKINRPQKQGNNS